MRGSRGVTPAVRRGLAGVLLLFAAMTPAQAGAAGSLPTVASGHLPGPDILYARPPRAPQLENPGGWGPPPLPVSGAPGSRRGGLLSQDFLYDAHGAAGFLDHVGAAFQ